MKVIDLRCQSGHRFEGWFASDEDFLEQNGRSLIECPWCADKVIVRLPSAPRLNLSGAREAAPQAESSEAATTLQSKWLEMVRHVMAHTEDVGERFADEARRIHYGEEKKRGIRGRVTPEEATELADEGVDAVTLPPGLVPDEGVH
mgnify:CR=1 FL=1